MTRVDGHTEHGGYIFHLQVAIAADMGGYDGPRAIYGDPGSVYGAGMSSQMWVTVDCQLLSVTAAHGARPDEIPGLRAELGRLTARLYDPLRILDPSASPFALLAYTGRPVRLVAVSADPIGPGPVSGEVIVATLWTGTVDEWEHDLLTGEGTLTASDGIARIAGVDLTAWVRPAESAHARYVAALAMMSDPPELLWDVATPKVLLSAVSLSGDLWSSAFVGTAEAEQAVLWMGEDGRLRHQSIARWPRPMRAVDCDDGSAPIVYTRLTSRLSEDMQVNIVRMERVNLSDAESGRPPLQVVEPVSVTRDDPHTLTRTDLPLLTDSALRRWGSQIIDLRADVVPGIAGMSVTVADALPWAARVASYALSNLHVGSTLDISISSRGTPYRWIAAVAGITHTIDMHSWEIDLDTADGPGLGLNTGYDHPMSRYDFSRYGRQAPDFIPTDQPEEAMA